MDYLELPVPLPDEYHSNYILPFPAISNNALSNIASTSRSLPPHAAFQQMQEQERMTYLELPVPDAYDSFAFLKDM